MLSIVGYKSITTSQRKWIDKSQRRSQRKGIDEWQKLRIEETQHRNQSNGMEDNNDQLIAPY